MSRTLMQADPVGSKSSVLPSDPATVSPSPNAGSSIHIFLTRSWFIVSWWLILLFHALLGSYALSVTALHRYLQNPSVYYAISGVDVPQQTLQVTARCFFLVGFAHFIAIVRILVNSIKAKQCILHSPKSTSRFVRPSLSSRSILYYPALALDCIVATWKSLFTGAGYLALSGPYFEVIFTIREAVEILLQTYQAYYLSRSVPRPWINNLAVISIVLNCIASPFTHWFYKHNVVKRRLVNLLQDAVLDFCCSVVIPLGIIMPYVAVFDTTANEFPIHLLMNDVWYVNAISEGRQVLVTSALDFISTIVPHMGLFTWLWTVKAVIRRQGPAASTSSSSSSLLRVQATLRSMMSRRIKPTASGPRFRQVHVAQRLRHASRNPEYVRHWRQFIVHLGFLAWGAFVVSLHLDAAYNTDRSVEGCQLFVNAWFHTGFPCSVMLLNCHMQRLNGTFDEITGVLAELERSSLQVLIFSHCSALEMPPMITEFQHISGLELFNCSLVDWPADAAVREDTLPGLSYVYIVLSNWTAFPDGLLHKELPESLSHLAIVGSNMTELPESIGEMWESHEWISMDIEKTPQLQQLPPSFCSIQTSVLQVSGTLITTFPSSCFVSMHVGVLIVSGTPVAAFPDLRESSVLAFYGEETAIAELPTWLDAWMERGSIAALYGSPVCNSSELLARTDLWEKLFAISVPSCRIRK